MLVLGVDPGAAATGFGFLEAGGGETRFVDAGVIRLPARRPLVTRLVELHRRLAELIALHSPEQVAVETLFHARSPRAAITLGHARGVILLAVAQSGAEFAEYTPLEIKQSVTGRGGASKEQVQDMMLRLTGAPAGMGLDASDALAVALCHVHRSRCDVVSV